MAFWIVPLRDWMIFSIPIGWYLFWRYQPIGFEYCHILKADFDLQEVKVEQKGGALEMSGHLNFHFQWSAHYSVSKRTIPSYFCLVWIRTSIYVYSRLFFWAPLRYPNLFWCSGALSFFGNLGSFFRKFEFFSDEVLNKSFR